MTATWFAHVVRRRPLRMAAVLFALTLATLPTALTAQVTLPPVNLGGDFLDGVGGPGVLFQQFVEYAMPGARETSPEPVSVAW